MLNLAISRFYRVSKDVYGFLVARIGLSEVMYKKFTIRFRANAFMTVIYTVACIFRRKFVLLNVIRLCYGTVFSSYG